MAQSDACVSARVPAKQATETAGSERRGLFFVVVDSTFEQRENVDRNCTGPGEFEQLLLTCIEGCGLRSNRFKVRAAACALHIL